MNRFTVEKEYIGPIGQYAFVVFDNDDDERPSPYFEKEEDAIEYAKKLSEQVEKDERGS